MTETQMRGGRFAKVERKRKEGGMCKRELTEKPICTQMYSYGGFD